MTENEVLIKTPEEAIETIKSNMPTSGYQMLRESLDMAISALKEIQLYKDNKLCLVPEDVYSRQCSELDAYKEIGSVEECREAVERQKPKGCNIVKDYFRTYYNCPKCNHNLRVEYNRGSWMGKKSKNCDKCGQAIRWDENLEGMEDE